MIQKWPFCAYLSFKISFDRKNCVIYNTFTFLILNGISEILVSICIYFCMSKKLNSYFSDVFCMASNFLNRYFVNVICICVYFFQDLSMVGIFFTSPHFIKFKDVSQIKVQPTTLFKANLVKQIWLISSSHIGLTGGVIYFTLTM